MGGVNGLGVGGFTGCGHRVVGIPTFVVIEHIWTIS